MTLEEHRLLKLTAANKFLTVHPRGSLATRVEHEYINSIAIMNSLNRHFKNSETVRKLNVNKVTRVTKVMPS